MKDKKSLLRWLSPRKGPSVWISAARSPGGGAYVCHDVGCLKKARKSRALERALETAIPPEVYDAMEAELEGQMDSHKILSLLGLALRGNHLAVGEEPVEAAARAKDARLLLLASDAADNTRRRTVHFSEAGQCLWLRLPSPRRSWEERWAEPRPPFVAVTDIGLANAVANRLAQLDEDQYGEAAERLALKAKRAAERQSELRAHEKNVRTGKYRPKPRRTPEDSSPQVEKVSARPAALKSESFPPQARQSHTVSPSLCPQPPGEKGQGVLPQT